MKITAVVLAALAPAAAAATAAAAAAAEVANSFKHSNGVTLQKHSLSTDATSSGNHRNEL